MRQGEKKIQWNQQRGDMFEEAIGGEDLCNVKVTSWWLKWVQQQKDQRTLYCSLSACQSFAGLWKNSLLPWSKHPEERFLRTCFVCFLKATSNKQFVTLAVPIKGQICNVWKRYIGKQLKSYLDILNMFSYFCQQIFFTLRNHTAASEDGVHTVNIHTIFLTVFFFFLAGSIRDDAQGQMQRHLFMLGQLLLKTSVKMSMSNNVNPSL